MPKWRASTVGVMDFAVTALRMANVFNCSAMTAAHRTLPFGARVRVCHKGCVVLRINDRGPWVRGRHIDLSPAAARAIGLYKTGYVTLSFGL